MRIAITSLLFVALAAISVGTPSCVIGGDEPWDAEEGSDTDTDTGTETAGDGDTDTDSIDYADGGADSGPDAG